jgi:hypothetical protein
MAGRFLSLEEAARHLGVTIDDIHRLVDRKKLFPMRDGATVKFKIEEIERVAGELGDEPSADVGMDDLDLELSAPGLGGPGTGIGSGDDVVLGEPEETESIFGSGVEPAGGMPSRTIVRGPSDAGGDDLVIEDRGSMLDSADLELESIIGASSPSLARGSGGGDSGAAAGSDAGTIALDAANLGSGPLTIGPRSGGLSGPPTGIGGGSGLGDSGLSLEGGDLGASGVDAATSGVDLATSGVGLGGGSGVVGGGSGIGDAFELGDGAVDDESASVVIATEDTGDSSFFGTVAEDSGSVSLDDSVNPPMGPGGEESYMEVVVGPPFSGLQILGLVCCVLFLLTGGLVMIDLVWSIRAPVGEPVSQPLLKALGEVFSWR